MDDQYYYSTPGGEVKGPAALGILKMQLKIGRLPKDSVVCRKGDNEWFPLADMTLEEAPVHAAPAKVEPMPQAGNPDQIPVFQDPGIATALSVLGTLGAIGSVLAIFLAFTDGNVMLGASAGASLVSSLALVGVSSAVTFAAEAVHILKHRR